MTSRGILVIEPYLSAIPSPFNIISPFFSSIWAVTSFYAKPLAIVLFPDPVVPINIIAWSTGLFIDFFPSESNFLMLAIYIDKIFYYIFLFYLIILLIGFFLIN